MGVEIEAKMRVLDLESVRVTLRAVGGQYVGVTREINRFYDTPDHRLRAGDQGLRVRTNTNERTGEASHVVTFKGPRRPGKLKTREELEFETSDLVATAAMLERLGYTRELSFEKRRESWSLGGCKIELDELPQLGTFVEVEGSDEETVEQVRTQLTLNTLPSISEGYASMVATLLEQRGETDLRFEGQ